VTSLVGGGVIALGRLLTGVSTLENDGPLGGEGGARNGGSEGCGWTCITEYLSSMDLPLPFPLFKDTGLPRAGTGPDPDSLIE
jgi:hypothetical protein